MKRKLLTKKDEPFKIKLWLSIDGDRYKHLSRVRGILNKFTEKWHANAQRHFNKFIDIPKHFFEYNSWQQNIIDNCKNTTIKLYIYVNCPNEKNNLKSYPKNTTFNRLLLKENSFYFIKKANIFEFYVTDRCILGGHLDPTIVFTTAEARKFFTQKFVDSLNFNIIYYV